MDERETRSFPVVHSISTACLVAFLLASEATPARPQTGARMIEIDKMGVGPAPADFTFGRTGSGGPGQWVVVDDATAPSKRAIEQSSTDRTDYRFPLAIYQPVTAKNVEVSLRFKPVAGRVDQAGGIAVRVTSPDDYYLVRANALEDNVRFYRIVKGRRVELASADVKVASGAWHTLALKAENDRFTVTFDGKTLHSTSDRTLPGPGRVALWTKSDSVTRFDQINILPLP
jgi:Galactocerebrosidase, C-terminal lectin domain